MTAPMTSIYLDHNATSPLRPEASAAVLDALDSYGNPSSVHAAGRAARARVEDARLEVARLVGADPEALIFTGGGTEANALGIRGAVAAGGIERLMVGATEHEAVVRNAGACGLPLEVWPVDGRGVADLDWLADRLAGGARGVLVALMLANNETGVVQPVAEAARLVHAAGGRLHVDAVQAAGKIEVDLEALGADTLALSAHKLGGPQGVGALVRRGDAALTPLVLGGGQERGLRAGTENVAGLAGFGAAAAAAGRDLPHAGRQAAMREEAAQALAAQGATVVGLGAPRLPGTLCAATPGWASALQVMALDLQGVCVSAGAACSSGKVRPSGVLQAMGLAPLAGEAIRVSGGWSTMAGDWARFIEVWRQVHARHAARVRAASLRVEEFA